MSHEKYGPVGYSFGADDYCLDCIPIVAAKPGKGNGGNGRSIGNRECNCAEHRLDRMSAARGINRMDEGSFDSSDFPKHIPYHNDLHSECGPDEFSDDNRHLCNARCARCGEVIDGAYQAGGAYVCPVLEFSVFMAS